LPIGALSVGRHGLLVNRGGSADGPRRPAGVRVGIASGQTHQPALSCRCSSADAADHGFVVVSAVTSSGHVSAGAVAINRQADVVGVRGDSYPHVASLLVLHMLAAIGLVGEF